MRMSKKKARNVSAILALVLALSAAACTREGHQDATSVSEDPEEDRPGISGVMEEGGPSSSPAFSAPRDEGGAPSQAYAGAG